MKTSVLLSIDPSFLEETLKTAWPSILGFLYNLAFAAVIAFIGIRLIGYVKKWSRKTFLRMKVEEGVARFLSSCLSVVLYGILIFVVAGRLGVNSASIVALLGSAGIAISLALQGSLTNFAGGVLHRNAGRIIAAIFKFGQTVQQNRGGLVPAGKTNNSTHR